MFVKRSALFFLENSTSAGGAGVVGSSNKQDKPIKSWRTRSMKEDFRFLAIGSAWGIAQALVLVYGISQIEAYVGGTTVALYLLFPSTLYSSYPLPS